MLEMKEKKFNKKIIRAKNNSSKPRTMPHAMKRLELKFFLKKQKFKTLTINLIGSIKSC